MKESELILSVSGFPPMSAYGCKQILAPIGNENVRRNINGDLVTLGTLSDKKYRSIVVGSGSNAAAFDNIWIGTQMQVGCIQMLWIPVDKPSQEVRISRSAVQGSVIAIDSSGKKLHIANIDGTLVRLTAPVQDKAFVGFRPWLTMQVVNLIMQTDEWENVCNWRLILEEI